MFSEVSGLAIPYALRDDDLCDIVIQITEGNTGYTHSKEGVR